MTNGVIGARALELVHRPAGKAREVLMTQHDALGVARGARGVKDYRETFRISPWLERGACASADQLEPQRRATAGDARDTGSGRGARGIGEQRLSGAAIPDNHEGLEVFQDASQLFDR